MTILALLATALLFGGATLFSFGLAPLVFAALPPDLARSTIRRAFPPFYLFVIVASAAASAMTWPVDRLAAALLALIAVTTIPTRQILMPEINQASDGGDKARFKALHGASVAITLVHIALAAYVLARFAARVAG
jgi:hypothetical protein